jgi:multidrug efflux pump subunit AcrA (membrane-fusion protein)
MTREIAAIVTITAALASIVICGAVMPAYRNPSNRTYTSSLGYPKVLRKLGKPFPVRTARLSRRTMSRTLLAEGVLRSDPVLVPIVPMGRIVKVHVSDGDRVRKGQLLAELDRTRGLINLDAAKAALRTAQAEMGRIRAGSNYNMRFERPALEAVLLDMAHKEEAVQARQVAMIERLQSKYYESRTHLLLAQLNRLSIATQVRQAEVLLEAAEKGRAETLKIGEAAVEEATLARQLREAELKDYSVLSPLDGTVERRLVQEGEYNSAPGKPSFLIASDPWFEAQLDQTSAGLVRVGDQAEVHLEARPGEVPGGPVTLVHPFVSYNLGGPEADRPIRPIGTGAPEWPATYAVRIKISGREAPGSESLFPGMTGYARFAETHDARVISRSALVGAAGNKAIVYVVNGTGFSAREVTTGIRDGQWIEIVSGLPPDAEIIVDGHHALKLVDSIAVVPGGK